MILYDLGILEQRLDELIGRLTDQMVSEGYDYLATMPQDGLVRGSEALWTSGYKYLAQRNLYEPPPAEESLLPYYPAPQRKVVRNCVWASALMMTGWEQRDVWFCFGLVRLAMAAQIWSEPIFAALKESRAGTAVSDDDGPPYRDHVLHTLNVYFFGDLLLRESSPIHPGKTGYALLADRLVSSQSDTAHACEELLGHRLSDLCSRDLLYLLRKAWEIASWCHDIGFLMSLITQLQACEEWRTANSGAHEFNDWRPDLELACKKGIHVFADCAVRAHLHVTDVLDELLAALANRGGESGGIDHGQCSAALLLNHFALAWKHMPRSPMQDVERLNLAAVFLAICAILRHRDKHWANDVDTQSSWRKDPLACFLAVVDQLQEFTRLCWFVDQPGPAHDPPLARICINAYMPIPRIRLDVNSGIKFECEEEKGGWEKAKALPIDKRERLARALGPDGLGLVPASFVISPCPDHANPPRGCHPKRWIPPVRRAT